MIKPVNRIDLIKKAEAQLKEGNYDEALGYITQCLDFFPAFSPAKVLLAELYFRKEKFEFAIKELTNIISDTPDNLRARKLLIEVLVKTGSTKEAESHLNFLEFMLPNDDTDYLRLKELVNSGNQIVVTEDLEKEIFDTKETLVDDEITDVFDQKEFIEKLANGKHEVEDIVPEDQIVTVTLDKKKENEDSGIKTMTLASIYEKQGMLNEALDILEKLYNEQKKPEVMSEIKRLKKAMGGESNFSLKNAKIEKLNKWLGKINAVK